MHTRSHKMHAARSSLATLLGSEIAFSSDDDLGSMKLTELMNEPVKSVSKKETKLSESAAAITVITQEDLRRLGVTSLPDALRLVPGMDVACISADLAGVNYFFRALPQLICYQMGVVASQ